MTFTWADSYFFIKVGQRDPNLDTFTIGGRYEVFTNMLLEDVIEFENLHPLNRSEINMNSINFFKNIFDQPSPNINNNYINFKNFTNNELDNYFNIPSQFTGGIRSEETTSEHILVWD